MNPKRLNLTLWLVVVVLAASSLWIGYLGITLPLDIPRHDLNGVVVASKKSGSVPENDIPTIVEITKISGLILRQKLIDDAPVAIEPTPAVPSVKPAPKLDLRLAGTVIESDRPYAIMADGRGVTRLLRVGEEMEDAKVLSISSESVTLMAQGQEITLEVLPVTPSNTGRDRR